MGVVPRDPGVRGASGDRWRRARAEIASVAGLTTMPVGGAYGASKPAVVAISETLHPRAGDDGAADRGDRGRPPASVCLILSRLSNG
jgi:hypothetical protein